MVLYDVRVGNNIVDDSWEYQILNLKHHGKMMTHQDMSS